MRGIASEMNLSETVFVQTPTALGVDFRFRFFTPKQEIPFAGHPTIGAVFSLMDPSPLNPEPQEKPAMDPNIGANELIAYEMRIEMGAGIFPVTALVRKGRVERVKMTQGKPEFVQVVEDLPLAAKALGIEQHKVGRPHLPMQVASTGLPHLFVPVEDLKTMKKIQTNSEAIRQLCRLAEVSCLMAFTLDTVDEKSSVHSRMFAPELGITEDPVTGSGSGALGAYLVHNWAFGKPEENETVSIVNEQGYEINRPGKVLIEIDVKSSQPSLVRIFGECVIVAAGTLRI